MKKNMLFIAMSLLLSQTELVAQDREKVVSLPEIRITSIALAAPKVSDAFRKAFPDAENLSWYKYDREYLAKFLAKDMEHNALFKQNGYMKYDISYGYETNIPDETKKLVTNTYDNYNIIRAINIKAEGRDIWIVKMEGMKKFVTIRIEDNEMDEVESFFKAE
jgi:patatin-like phospholipase/acyl hydrolase